MIKITVPNNNIQERRYIIEIIFNQFLEIEYQIVENQISDSWTIEFENGSKLIFEDHFFSKYTTDLEYLKLENIPSNVKFIKNEFLLEEDLPVIYGNDNLEISEYKIICGIDIFASSFFMLTRWEEHVNKNRDKHNRFPAIESLAFKNNFLDRPIVNEYLEMIKKMILKLDNSILFKKYTYKLILTHDVDSPKKYRNLIENIRELAVDIIIQKSIISALKSFKRQIKYF